MSPTRLTAPGFVMLLAGLTVLAHLLGATVLRGWLWGAHFYAFLPPLAPGLALLVGGAVLALALRSRHVTARWSVLLAAVAVGLFWWLRIQHEFLGDAGPLTQSMVAGERFHPRQPLTMLLHQLFHGLTRGWLAAAERTPLEVARLSVALESVLAGGLFVWVAVALGREIERAAARRGTTAASAVPADAAMAAGSPEAAGGRASAAPLLTAILLGQGYVQLFFGYVENYTLYLLVLGLYLWLALRHLDGRAPLLGPAAVLVVAIGLNLAGLVLVPSLVVLAIRALVRRSSRAGALRDLALAALLLVAEWAVLLRLGGGYDPGASFQYMVDLALHGDRDPGRLWALLGAAHLRDEFSLHLLIGPFAALFAVPMLGMALRSRAADVRLWFLATAVTFPLVASLLTGDLHAGFPRDWDLFAPYGLVYASAGLYALLVRPPTPRALRAALGAAVVASMLHTLPWVLVNASETRSLARFETLPLGRGRTELVLGNWYLRRGMKEEARRWFQRSVEAYPANNSAQYQLGLFAVDEQRLDEAIERFTIAVRVRPDKTNYRFALVDAFVLAGRPAAALPHLETLTRAEPSRAEFWGCFGIVLMGLGRTEEARRALQQGARLSPGTPRFTVLLAGMDQPDAYARAVREHWDALIVGE